MPSEPSSSWTHAQPRLDRVNEAFHQAYDEARGRAQHQVPVLVFLGDVVALHVGQKRLERNVTPLAYLALRSAAHAPLGLFSLLVHVRPGKLERGTMGRLRAVLERVEGALARLDAEVEDAAGRTDARSVLEDTRGFLTGLLESGQHRADELTAFARGRAPALLRLTDHATRLQLGALDAAASELFATLSAEERRALQVVVAGAHQARQRSLGMQYFRKRLREPAHEEDRVTYAENAADEEAALALVATRKLDGDVANAFFGDSKRLQRDVLGDAVEKRLAELNLPDGEGP